MAESRRHRGGRSPEERRVRSRLAQLLSERPFVRGTLSIRYHRCGKANCRCTRGEKHRVPVLTIQRDKRYYQLNVPAAWEDTVREWIENRAEIERLMEELSDLHWEKVRNRQG